jgi:hypothetical protein
MPELRSLSPVRYGGIRFLSGFIAPTCQAVALAKAEALVKADSPVPGLQPGTGEPENDGSSLFFAGAIPCLFTAFSRHTIRLKRLSL